MSQTLDELIREHTGRSTRTPSSYKFKQAILAWVNEEVIGENVKPGTPWDWQWEGRNAINIILDDQREKLKHHGFKETL